MNQELVTNQLSYITTQIIVEKENGKTTGSGFFYGFDIKNSNNNFTQNQGTLLLLITNKHVIDNALNITIYFNLADDNNEPILGSYHQVNLLDISNIITFHPNEDVDLAFLNISLLIDKLIERNINIYLKKLNNHNLISKAEFENLTSGEDVLMVGYPAGVRDEKNNQPIFRKGITATNPNINFNGKNEFLIDISAFGGSSGSPVFLYTNGVFLNESKKLRYGKTIKLIGVLYAGRIFPEIINEVELHQDELQKGFLKNTSINLGIVISVFEIVKMKELFQKKYNITLN